MNDLKTYCVDFAVRGYKCIYVQAKDVDEASRLAAERINETNFGELDEIACEEIDLCEEQQ